MSFESILAFDLSAFSDDSLVRSTQVLMACKKMLFTRLSSSEHSGPGPVASLPSRACVQRSLGEGSADRCMPGTIANVVP